MAGFSSVPCLSYADALPVVHRTFGTSDMLSLWIGLVVCLPSWYLAGSLVDMGAAEQQSSAVPFAFVDQDCYCWKGYSVH